MQMPLKTPAAAATLGVQVYVLTGLFRYGKMTAPAKDSSGDYLWTPQDLERARAALAAPRVRKAVKS